jgi:hypothetical protein
VVNKRSFDISDISSLSAVERPTASAYKEEPGGSSPSAPTARRFSDPRFVKG